MKKKAKIFITIIILIIVIGLLVLLGNKILKKQENTQHSIVISEDSNGNTEKIISINKKEKVTGEEKLEVQGLEIKNMEEENSIEGNIKNTSNRIVESGPVNVTLLDKDGNEVLTFVTYLDDIQENEEISFQASSTEDLSNVVSYKISK